MSNVIRFQFRKGASVRFLSHLDLVRTMERAIRRAKLPIAYSGGFTPRPIMSYSFALPVGVISEAEYGDFEFLETLDPVEFIEIFNQHLPSGFTVLQAENLPEKTPSLMRAINAASWELVMADKTASELEARWQLLQGMDKFVVERITKKGRRSVDLLPLLYEVRRIAASPEGTVIVLFSALGNEGNLRVKELETLFDLTSMETTITRTGQFKKTGDQYSPPLRNRGQ